MQHGPRKNLMQFEHHLNLWADTQIIFHFLIMAKLGVWPFLPVDVITFQ